MLLETRKRDGTWVPTPVNPYVDGDRVVFRTWSTSGKAKRLRHTAAVRIAPCTRRGRRTGEQLLGEAHRLEGRDAECAAALIKTPVPVASRCGGAPLPPAPPVHDATLRDHRAPLDGRSLRPVDRAKAST
jgi:PPOX class probable F420-dependent enzyme